MDSDGLGTLGEVRAEQYLVEQGCRILARNAAFPGAEIDLIAQETADVPGRTVRLVMTYCNCPERAVKLRSDLLERCPAIREVIMSPTGGLSTMYAGDGGIVIAYGADKAE